MPGQFINLIIKDVSNILLIGTSFYIFLGVLNFVYENKGYIHNIISEVENAHLCLQKVIRSLIFLREWANKETVNKKCANMLHQAEEIGQMAYIHAEWAMLEFEAAVAIVNQNN